MAETAADVEERGLRGFVMSLKMGEVQPRKRRSENPTALWAGFGAALPSLGAFR